MEKMQYEALVVETIAFGAEDVIATSCTTHTPPDEETPEVDPFG